VEFSRIFRSVEFGGHFIFIEFSRNFKLVNPGGFSRF